MNDDKKVLGIIPARGGSKGIPRKNIRLLAGKPLIAYAIEVGLASPSIDRLIVSTDDEEIATVARKYGAEVPFLRPETLAADSTPDRPVFQHALNWLMDKEGYQADFVLNLRCTTPFKIVADVEAVIEKLIASGSDSVRTMTQTHGVHHPWWMYTEVEGVAKPLLGDLPEGGYQRQLLPKVYRLNGVVDGVKASVALEHSVLWGDTTSIVDVPEVRSFDIDTEFDFKLADLMARNKPFLQKG